MAGKQVSFTVYRGSAEGKIVEDTTTRTLGPKDAFVRLTHSGVCGTDEHFLHSGCVLGHEGVGIVEDIGSEVTNLKKGARVGFGYVHKVCGQCEYCLSQKEQFCSQRQMFGSADLDEGSYGSHVVWQGDMLLEIPDTIEFKHAAPLMCAGATVWTALTMYGLQPGDRVGVQGIGGLGHLAIQFAAKLGCEVTVLSSSESKREAAMALGATNYYVMNGNDLKLPDSKKIKHLLICGSANPDYSKLVPIMANDGVMYPLTVSNTAVPILLHDLVVKGVRIQGSCVSSRPVMRRMLQFAALHGIKPQIQEFPMSVQGVEDAMAALRAGKLRYKAVLVN